MNAAVETAPTLQAIPLEQISLGKNYRHRRPSNWEQKLDELGASMKANGQLEPVLVRPTETNESGEYQIVFGERRYRAAKKAGLATLLCIVRDVSDDQVLETQVEENNQREDPHPLDEAEGFAELVKRGRTPAEIAARLGRDPSYVAKRLALTQLGKGVLDAFDGERITFSVALLLARLPDKKMQDDALQSILSDSYDGPMPAEDARKLIEEHFMLRLEKAPFDITDAKLVPKAGPCSTCPKRTGNQRELFDDVKSADLCTDEKCFKAKSDAIWQIRKKEAAKGGTEVIEGAAADAARHGYGTSKFRRLDDDTYLDGGRKKTSIRKLLGKDLPPIALARDTNGEVFEVVPRADVNKAMRTKAPERDAGGDDSYKQTQAREQKKTKLRRKAIVLAIEQGIAAVGKKKPEDVLALVVRAFSARAWNEVQTGILDRRGVKRTQHQGAEAALLKLAKGLEGYELAGLGLELAMRAGAPWGNYAAGSSEIWRDALALMKIDFPALEKQVATEAKKPKAKAPASKPKAKKAAKKKGRK